MGRCRCIILFSLMLCLMGGCAGNISDSRAQSSDPPDDNPPNVTESILEPVEDDIANRNDEYLPLITVDNGYTVTDYAESLGSEYQYKIFELENLSNITDYSRDIYWEVVVVENETVVAVLRQVLDEYAGPIPTAATLVLEVDVNFDDKNDILFWLGHFGAQGLIRYDCVLNTDGEFIYCPSFSSISNPAVDEENQVILSSWRNWAASHSYAMYYFIDGAYIEMERLTEEPLRDENLNELWTWTDEIFVDGEWKLREYFTEADYDDETLYSEKVYGEGSYWDIAQDRWRTLYNNGMMADFSIYSSEYVEVE